MEKYIQGILSNITSGIIIMDTDDKITVYNKSAEEILNIPSGKVVNTNLRKITELKPVYQTLKETETKGKNTARLEIALALPTGRWIVLGLSTSILYDDAQKKIGVMAIFRDITGVIDSSKLAQQKERLALLGQMSSIVAHEIKSPLLSITGFADLILMKPDNAAKNTDYAKRTHQEVDRILRIIKDLLDYAKEIKFEYELSDIKKVVKETIEGLFQFAINKKVKIRYNEYQEIPQLKIDKDRIKQVVSNLIMNSIEASKENTEITVSVKRIGGKVAVEVADSGVGIPESAREKLFTPFFSTKKTGTGLGLAISRRIIESHLGEINIESEQGKGTTFSVILPVRQ